MLDFVGLNTSKFSWCSGYHICLTHRRSPVRSRAKTSFPRGLTARISGFHPGGPGSTPGVGILFCPAQIEFHLATDCSSERLKDEVAEWLRRWTANPMGSARVGSNPILVEFFCHTCGKKKYFRYRELNPGHLGESQVS